MLDSEVLADFVGTTFNQLLLLFGESGSKICLRIWLQQNDTVPMDHSGSWGTVPVPYRTDIWCRRGLESGLESTENGYLKTEENGVVVPTKKVPTGTVYTVPTIPYRTLMQL